MFIGTGAQLIEDGPEPVHKARHHHLGTAVLVGTADFMSAYLNREVAAWAAEVG